MGRCWSWCWRGDFAADDCLPKGQGTEFFLPEPPVGDLDISKLLGREAGMEIQEDFSGGIDLILFDPYAVALPINFVLQREHAVGVDEERNSP